MQTKWIDIILLGLVVIVICFLIFTVNFMKSNARQCMADPVRYFEKLNKGAVCYCIKDGQGYQNFTINLSHLYSLPEGMKP